MKNPKLIPVPFATDGIKDQIPLDKTPAMEDSAASWRDGFPMLTMNPVYRGGLPPRGEDFNGVLNQMSENIVFMAQGGRFKFDPEYASDIGGYQKGATLQTNDESAEYQSLIDNNLVDFNTASQAEIAAAWRITGLGDATEVLNGKLDKSVVKQELGTSKAEIVSQNVVTQLGTGIVGSFEKGLTYLPYLTNNKQQVTIENEYGVQAYCWTGEFPKEVPIGSTPESTGGIAKGAWDSVGDASLRGDLSSYIGSSMIGGSYYIVETFNDALNSSSVRSSAIKTLCHHIKGKGSAEYVRTGNTGVSSSGDESLFCNADGIEWRLSNNLVDYYIFGSELDGITDDTLNIIKAHRYLDLFDSELVQSGGIALVRPDGGSKQIKINSSCTFLSDFEFLLDTNTSRGFIVRDEESEIILSQDDVNINEFKVSRMRLTSLSSYVMHHAVILSNEVDLNRKRTSGDALQLKKQPVIVGYEGGINAPLWTTFNSIEQVILQPLTIPVININGLRIRTTGSIDNASPFVVRRNNVNFNNVKYINGETNKPIPIQNLIAYEYSANSSIDGVTCESLSKGIVDNNYVINTWCSTNINIRNMTSFDGWAQLDGNYCRGVTLRDSDIDRAGSHFRGYDYTFENLNTRKGRCIAVSGGGLLYVRNIKQYIDSVIVADEQYTTVSLRADYGAEWDGVIDVDGVTMDFTNFYSDKIDTSATVVSSFIDSSVGVHNFQRSVKLARSITVKNVKFILSPTMTRAYMRAVGVGCTSSIVSGVSYPNSITVDNVSCSNLGGVNKFKLRGVEWNTVSRNEEFKNRAKISISNVQNIDPAAYNETILDETRHLFNVITTGENSIITADINNCHFGSVNVSGKGVTVNYSGGSITYFSGEINDKTMINFDNATFYGTRFRGAIKVTVSSCCFANYIDITGSSVPIGNGQNVDTNIVYIQNTRTEQGATIASSAINANNAKTGYVLNSYFK